MTIYNIWNKLLSKKPEQSFAGLSEGFKHRHPCHKCEFTQAIDRGIQADKTGRRLKTFSEAPALTAVPQVAPLQSLVS